LDGFGQVRDGEAVGAFEVGDGSSDFKDPVVGAGGQPLLLHGALEETFGVWTQFAVGPDLPGGHLGIGVDIFLGFGEALLLTLPGGKHAGPDFGRAFGGG